jgi:phosphoribosylformylglycinamidine synthase
VIFKYAGADWKIAEKYPDNPNGSTDAIAGICNCTGNVLGLMPHPEKYLYPQNSPYWCEDGLAKQGSDGREFFGAIVKFARKAKEKN